MWDFTPIPQEATVDQEGVLRQATCDTDENWSCVIIDWLLSLRTFLVVKGTLILAIL